jgi:hypothetical protein
MYLSTVLNEVTQPGKTKKKEEEEKGCAARRKYIALLSLALWARWLTM